MRVQRGINLQLKYKLSLINLVICSLSRVLVVDSPLGPVTSISTAPDPEMMQGMSFHL